jgi:hypothetical protein
MSVTGHYLWWPGPLRIKALREYAVPAQHSIVEKPMGQQHNLNQTTGCRQVRQPPMISVMDPA